MRKYFVILVIVISPGLISCQTENDTIFVAFWNLQNLFDTIDDPKIDDEEFLPNSEPEWTDDRLDKKMFNLARTIRKMDNDRGPDILGVCEVENESVLVEMVNRYLSDLSYGIAYIESPDNRGIDNGLIFKKDKFKILNVQADTVHLADGWPTRLIFGVNLLTLENKELKVYVNHWPSRSGGQLESEPKRMTAARTLRLAVDRIFELDSLANIIIIGDFNDEPVNKSVLETLAAHPLKCDSLKTDFEFETAKELFNLSYGDFENEKGTFKYKDDWNMLDQIIVSGNLITGNYLSYICGSFEIFKPDFLVTKSGQYSGAPFPTYGGRRYLGGYSDHFPVTAKFLINRSEE